MTCSLVRLSPRTLVVLTVVTVAGLCGISSATDSERPAGVGTIFMKDGSVFHVADFGHFMGYSVKWIEDSNKLTLGLDAATQVRPLDLHWLEISMRDGRVIQAKDPKIGGESIGRTTLYFVKTYFDRVVGEWSTQDARAELRDIERLEFTATRGVKRCPQCDRLFPGEYYFCPYDATSLIWRDAPTDPAEDKGQSIPAESGVSWNERDGFVEVFREGIKIGEYPRQIRLSGVREEDRAKAACEAATVLVDLLASVAGLPGTGAPLPLCSVIVEDEAGAELSTMYFDLSMKDQMYYSLKASGFWGSFLAKSLRDMGFRPDTELTENGLVLSF